MIEQNKQQEKQEDFHLKGTFLSVMTLGALIIVGWFLVYFLFLSRP